MTNYTNLSDLQINGYVLHYLRNGNATRKEQLSVASGETDYCNNWADAGPIIVENGIGFCAKNGNLVAATNNSYEYYEPHGSVVYDSHDGNILRAAMIVFLMMKDGEE
jgi:hypothetical protein